MDVAENTPLVSVIIPSYNHAPYLRERVESVLGQTLQDFELILLDDCSADGSGEILKEYSEHPRVSHVIVNERNSGSTFCQWKRGLELARGKYVWIAESDDSADPVFLETLVAELEKNPRAVLAYSGSVMTGPDGKPISSMDWDRWRSADEGKVIVEDAETTIRKQLLFTTHIYNASMVVFRRESAPAIEADQLAMRYAGDWLFWLRFMARGTYSIRVNRKMNRFRQHDRKVSAKSSKDGRYFLEGLPIMTEVADRLSLNALQRRVMAGRTLRRLRGFREFEREHGAQLVPWFEKLSPGSPNRRLTLEALYELDKHLHFSKLL